MNLYTSGMPRKWCSRRASPCTNNPGTARVFLCKAGSQAWQDPKPDDICSAFSVQHQTSQWAPPLQFSTPDPHINQSLECPVQVQSVQRNAAHSVQVQTMQRNAEYPVQIQSLQRTPLADVDVLLNTELTGILSLFGYQGYHTMRMFVVLQHGNINDVTFKSKIVMFL